MQEYRFERRADSEQALIPGLFKRFRPIGKLVLPRGLEPLLPA